MTDYVAMHVGDVMYGNIGTAHRLRDLNEDWEVFTLSDQLDPECVGCRKNISEVDSQSLEG